MNVWKQRKQTGVKMETGICNSLILYGNSSVSMLMETEMETAETEICKAFVLYGNKLFPKWKQTPIAPLETNPCPFRGRFVQGRGSQRRSQK